MSRDKFESEAQVGGCKSSAESIGVHRSQSSRMSRYKLKLEAGRSCKSSVESILVHRSQSCKETVVSLPIRFPFYPGDSAIFVLHKTSMF